MEVTQRCTMTGLVMLPEEVVSVTSSVSLISPFFHQEKSKAKPFRGKKNADIHRVNLFVFLFSFAEVVGFFKSWKLAH